MRNVRRRAAERKYPESTSFRRNTLFGNPRIIPFPSRFIYLTSRVPGGFKILFKFTFVFSYECDARRMEIFDIFPEFPELFLNDFLFGWRCWVLRWLLNYFRRIYLVYYLSPLSSSQWIFYCGIRKKIEEIMSARWYWQFYCTNV